MAVTLKQADEMIAECRRANVLLTIPIGPRISPIRELIDKGIIGKVIGTRIVNTYDKPDSYWEGGYSGRVKLDWRKRWETSGGGVLMINTVYTMHRMRYATGLEVERVYSEYGTFCSPKGVEVEDLIMVVLRYNNGAIGNIESGSCVRGMGYLGKRYPASLPEPPRIYGTEGQIILSKPVRVYTTKETELGKAGVWHETFVEERENREDVFEEFAKGILSGELPKTVAAPEDARKILEITLAAYKSGLEGKPVNLPL